MHDQRLAGPLLARIRRKKEIKAVSVAKPLELSLSTYSQIECGHRNLSMELCMAICQVIGISAAAFCRRLEKAMKNQQSSQGRRVF